MDHKFSLRNNLIFKIIFLYFFYFSFSAFSQDINILSLNLNEKLENYDTKLLELNNTSGVSSETIGFTIRAHGGIGLSRSSNSKYTGTAYLAGARFLLNAGNGKRYGIETTWLNINDAGDVLAAGFVLENKVNNWFHMSIGTIGYINFPDVSDNPVGLTTTLGWEPNGLKFKILIGLRNDFILYKKLVTLQSLTVGISW